MAGYSKSVVKLRKIAAIAALVGGGSLLWAGVANGALVHRFLYELEGPRAGKQFAEPCGVATDSYGNIYAASSSNGLVYVFNPKGVLLTTVEEGLAGAALRGPCSLAVDSGGNLYVQEEVPGGSSVGRVVLFKPGSYPPTAETKYRAERKVTEGEVGRNIRSISIGPATDDLYVNEQSRIVEIGAASKGSPVISDAIGEGLISFSYGVAVDPAGDVYATSAGRVLVLDPETNKVLRSVPEPPDAPLPGLLQNIALDEDTGNLFVFVKAAGVIDEFDPTGALTGKIGPAFGASKDSLLNADAVDLTVDNGSFSPNRGDIYIVSGSAAKSRLYAYGPLEEPRPIVLTGAPSAPTETSVTLNGTVDPQGIAIEDCHFDYVDEAAYESDGFASGQTSRVPCGESASEIGTGSGPVPVHANLTGLAPGAYRFRLVAENENPPAVFGEPAAFGPPEIVVESARPVFFTEATARATINPEGFPTNYRIEYGSGDGYDQSSSPIELPGESTDLPVAVQLTGLAAGTEYHYRWVATNALTTTFGPNQTFKTLPEAEAASSCPNANYRTGPSAGLPDCRAYELVTPPDMNGTAPFWPATGPENSSFPSSLASPDGNSAVFITEGTLPDTNGNGVFDGHRSIRGANGWREVLVGPSGAESSAASPGGFSADNAYSFWRARGDYGSLGGDDGYLQLPDATARAQCSPKPLSHFEYIGCGDQGQDPKAIGRFISPGAGHVIFTSKDAIAAQSPPQGTTAIYDRSPGSDAQLVSLLPDGATPSGPAAYAGVSKGGTAVAFTTEENGITTLYVRRNNSKTLEVASGETAFAGLSQDGSRVFFARRPFSPNEEPSALFVCDLDVGSCAGEDAHAPIEIASNAMFVNVSEDGSRAYFTSDEDLYLWDAQTETTDLVATLDPSDVGGSFTSLSLSNWIVGMDPEATGVGWGPAMDPSRSTPDGKFLIFQSHASLTSYDSDGHSEIYRYDAVAKVLTCLSCSQSEAPAEADALLQDETKGAPIQSAQVLIRNLSEDGSTAFFNTADALLPTDVNDVQDVYEWHSGRLALISTGQSPQSSSLYAVSANGNDVFFTTRQSLLPSDEEEGGTSLYDARVGGGFATVEGLGNCQEDSCQGAANAAPHMNEPPTVGLRGSGKASPRHARCPKGRVHRRKAHCIGHHKRRHHHRSKKKRLSR